MDPTPRDWLAAGLLTLVLVVLILALVLAAGGGPGIEGFVRHLA